MSTIQLLAFYLLAACGPAALLIAIYTAVRFFRVINKIREESRTGHEVAARTAREHEDFVARETESRERLMQRFEVLEAELRERAEQAESVATAAQERLLQLEKYLKEFFEVELKAVFDSFDKTVASVLEEMKAELLRGVDRIEEIQAVVESRTFAQERILDGEGSVYRLVAGGDSKSVREQPDRPEDSSSASDAPEGPGLSLEEPESP